MAVRMDRDVRRVTVMKPGESGGSRKVYRFSDDDDDDSQPIKRVTVLKRDEQGRLVARESYDGERRGKKQTKGLRPVERGVRNLLEFQVRVLDNYLGRHKRSNEKRRDGWLVDMPRNVMQAVKKSKPRKLFRISRIVRDRD
ncbi:MAG: hypothetical protein AB7O80_03180 [Acetobacteraceae bacterium]